MTYTGTTVQIPMGQGGLRTDDSQLAIPPQNLIQAENISISSLEAQKAPGSSKFNSVALPAAIMGIYDWFPTATQQRLIAVTQDGKVYRDTGDGTFTANTAFDTELGNVNNQLKIVAGGLESASDNRKLFIFSGSRQLQFLDGDATDLTTISGPAADWASNFPTAGVLHRSRLFAFGNTNDPHRVYMSDSTDHQDFSGGASATFSVFPGEGNGLIAGFVYKGRLFIVKEPTGVYYLIDQDTSAANWYFAKLSATFGVSSAHGTLQALDDMFVGNVTGSITSLKAVDAFGDVESGDLLNLLRIEQFIRNNTSTSGIPQQHSIYFEEQKQALFTYRSTAGSSNDRLLVIDYNLAQNPRAVFMTKDNPNCMALRKGANGIFVPMYGTTDGYVFVTDIEDRNVGGTAYTAKFQTPHMDFNFVDPSMAQKDKHFDFLEVVFKPEGKWDLAVEYFIDGDSVETKNVEMSLGKVLGGPDIPASRTFVLGDKMRGTELVSRRVRLRGSGKRISFQFTQGGLDQNINISSILVSFRLGDERQVVVN